MDRDFIKPFHWTIIFLETNKRVLGSMHRNHILSNRLFKILLEK